MSYTLYNALAEIAARTTRFHMPGHKGKAFFPPLDGVYAIDFTETDATGNLYADTPGILQQAEARAGAYFGGHCHFLTCGATQGVKAMLGSYAMGQTVLFDRNTHKSVVDACVQLDITPQYIQPEFLPEYGVTAGFNLSTLEEILLHNPKISAFFVTSPTYYGYIHNLESIVTVCHRHGVTVLVDSAHGSHLRMCGLPDPIFQGADCVVYSAHKTLDALTQGAYLVFQDESMDTPLKRFSAFFGTTSPSYPILVSLDIARQNAQQAEPEAIAALIEQCQCVRSQFQTLGLGSPCLGDPLRIVLSSPFASRFNDFYLKNGLVPELCDGRNIVFIVTPRDTATELQQISQLAAACISQISMADYKADFPPPPPLPVAALSPRAAFFSPMKTLPLQGAIGRIIGENLFLYPPGVPILAIGERIDEISLEYLRRIRYNIDKDIQVVSQNTEHPAKGLSPQERKDCI